MLNTNNNFQNYVQTSLAFLCSETLGFLDVLHGKKNYNNDHIPTYQYL